MKLDKVEHCYCINDCNHRGEGFVIKYNDDESLIYLCEKCLDKLTVTLNNSAAERWLDSEME